MQAPSFSAGIQSACKLSCFSPCSILSKVLVVLSSVRRDELVPDNGKFALPSRILLGHLLYSVVLWQLKMVSQDHNSTHFPPTPETSCVSSVWELQEPKTHRPPSVRIFHATSGILETSRGKTTKLITNVWENGVGGGRSLVPILSLPMR